MTGNGGEGHFRQAFEVTLEGQAKGIPAPEQPVGGPEVGESSVSLKKGVEAIAS